MYVRGGEVEAGVVFQCVRSGNVIKMTRKKKLRGKANSIHGTSKMIFQNID